MSKAQYIDVVMDTIQRLDVMDPSMANHRHRTADRIVSLANAFGCPQEEVQLCFWAGMLHDIGKIIVPKEILQKREALRAEDWQIMRRHPDAGAEIVNKIDWLSPAADIIKAHHERYDGRGLSKWLGWRSYTAVCTHFIGSGCFQRHGGWAYLSFRPAGRRGGR